MILQTDLESFGADLTGSVPMMAISITIDLVRRAIRTQRNPANDNLKGE